MPIRAPRSSEGAARYRALDGYRFVAALCVVIFHYNIDFHLELDRFFPAIRGFGVMVDLFFLLSGFVIAKAYLNRMRNFVDYKRFLQARLARIYPLHVLSTLGMLVLFAVAIAVHAPLNHPEVFALSGLPANLALAHAWGVLDHISFNGASWSISAEWFVYLLTPFFFLLARELSFSINLFLAAAAFVAITATRQQAGLGPLWGATYDWGMMRAVPTFFAGVAISVHVDRLPNRAAPPWFVVHGLFLAALAGLYWRIPYEAVVVLFALLIAGAALAERVGRETFMAGPFMAKLGDASYSVYMMHGLISAPAVLVTKRLGLMGAPLAGGAAVIAIVTLIAASIWVYDKIELPLRRYFGPRAQWKASEELALVAICNGAR